ncbi:MAG: hypothetical protein R3B06_10665 [Kofleriaceae bacterium]
MVRALVLALAVGMITTPAAAADDRCHDELDARGVAWSPARRPGIVDAVAIHGPLGGVAWIAPGRDPLVVDCSLAVSLAAAGRYFLAVGLTEARWSSGYSVRNVRGTTKRSKHSVGLAVDLPRLAGPEVGLLAVTSDYEPGLGDDIDCLGQPLTAGGAVLKVLQCQLVRSGLFFLVLSPDYDDAHHDHFHLEARPWAERPQVVDARAAIH